MGSKQWNKESAVRIRANLDLLLVLFLAVIASEFISCAADAAELQAPRINVILWFDTEDYLLPADDDATKRLCDLLAERGIRATFKLVGEKARVLERRGRQDVIAALRRHDIGYHSDFHSVHPTPTEYLADCGWLDGIAEFARREGPGAADVRRILQVPTLSCYGQPGSSWAPQAIAALRQIGVAPAGIPCYLDEGSHVSLNGRPFWYAGALNVFGMRPNLARMELHQPDDLERAEQDVKAIAARLAREGGGVISIFYHPCEWVHRQFWDSVNFSRGANPPREQWIQPAQRPAQETEAAFRRFGQYIDFIRALPGVQWVTATDLPGLFPDLARSEGATHEDLDLIARSILNAPEQGIDFLSVGSRAYSPADQFELLACALTLAAGTNAPQFPIQTSGILGPDSLPLSSTVTNLPALAFRDALLDVYKFVHTEHRVPARVFMGAQPIAPGDFLVAMAHAWTLYRTQHQPPGRSEVVLGQHVRIATEKHVADDTPGLFGGWIVHPEGFRAPKVVALAKLQAWTLKPAIPRNP